MEKSQLRGSDPLSFLDQSWTSGRLAGDLLQPFLRADLQVLEIGSGLGRVSRHVVGQVAHLTCADILPEALQFLGQQFPEIHTHPINGADLAGLEDNRFDLVYSFATFFHLDWELVVRYFIEIRRVMRPGGRAILEFMPWRGPEDLHKLEQKIAHHKGLFEYHRLVDKWRYVSPDMLAVLSQALDFQVESDDVTAYRIRKPNRA